MYPVLIAAALSLAQAEAPPSPQLVERFIAALPERQNPIGQVDPAELARFAQLNPGREGDIHPILEAHARCTAPVREASTNLMLRLVAARLGTTSVEALIRFYEGPDLLRFGALAAKTDRSAEENAELERLQRAYPLEALMEAMQTAGMDAFNDDSFFNAMDACDRTRDGALAGARLRSEG